MAWSRREQLGYGVPPVVFVVVFGAWVAAQQIEAAGYGDQLQVQPEDDGMVEIVGDDGQVYRLEQWRPPPKPNAWIPFGAAVGVAVLIGGLGSAIAWGMAGPDGSDS